MFNIALQKHCWTDHVSDYIRNPSKDNVVQYMAELITLDYTGVPNKVSWYLNSFWTLAAQTFEFLLSSLHHHRLCLTPLSFLFFFWLPAALQVYSAVTLYLLSLRNVFEMHCGASDVLDVCCLLLIF